MAKILCYLYPDFAEFEVTFLFHKLKNVGGREIIPISHNLKPVQSQSGFVFTPNATVRDALRYIEVEALVIPGGPITPSPPEITELIQSLSQRKILLAAICNGPQFLGRAGILNQHPFTTSCSEENIQRLGVPDPFPRQKFVDRRVVRDGHVITAIGRAFIDFSFEVLEYLDIFSDKNEMEQLRRDVLGIYHADSRGLKPRGYKI